MYLRDQAINFCEAGYLCVNRLLMGQELLKTIFSKYFDGVVNEVINTDRQRNTSEKSV